MVPVRPVVVAESHVSSVEFESINRSSALADIGAAEENGSDHYE